MIQQPTLQELKERLDKLTKEACLANLFERRSIIKQIASKERNNSALNALGFESIVTNP